MAGKIFINYRRDDSISTAGRLHDRLAQTFGRKNLFMDVDHVPAGVDFVDYLHKQVAACDVFLAIIGPNWLSAKDNRGRRRFDNPNDYVTIEIAAALARNIRVIPVLVDGARTPNADKLPDSIKPLVRRNAVEVRNTNFGRDAEALANKVREALKDAPTVPRRWPLVASASARLMAPGRWRMVAGGATALLLAGWIGLYQMGVPVWVPWTSRAEQPNPPRVDKAKAVAEAQRSVAEAEQQRQAKAATEAEAKLKAAEAEQQRLAATEEQQRQAKAAADVEAKLKAAEAEQQRLKEEAQRQAKAAADAEAKLKAAEAEQQRLATDKAEEERKAKAAADAEAKRKAAEGEQQRLAAAKAEEERKAKAEAEAVTQRKAAEAEQQRLAVVKAETERNAKAAAEAAAQRETFTGLFTMRGNTEVGGKAASSAMVDSTEACAAVCARDPACKLFTYNKTAGICYTHSSTLLRSFTTNEKYDSGIFRPEAEQQRPKEEVRQPTSATGLFTMRRYTEAVATSHEYGFISSARAPSTAECEQKCAQFAGCKIFTYDRDSETCYIYSGADFRQNNKFDSGVRK
jgi:hypothetical protein